MIINSDSVWRAGETIVLSDDVQIAAGATLTIEEGVTVRGGRIDVFGTLTVEGSATDMVRFEDVSVTFGNTYQAPGRIDMAFADWVGGSFLPATGNASYGSFAVSDSVFVGTVGFYIWYPTADSSFVGNLFDGTSAVSVGTDREATLTIEGNSFINSLGGGYHSQVSAIEIWAAYGDPVQLHGNTFSIPEGRYAIEL